MTDINDLPKLTKKREGFAMDWLESGVAAEAYRKNFSTENMKANTIHQRAHEVLHNSKVQARIQWEKAQRDQKRLEIEEIARRSASEALQTLVSIQNDPKAPASSRVAAAGAVLDRAYGKPVSKTELDATLRGKDALPEELSDAELMAMLGTKGEG